MAQEFEPGLEDSDLCAPDQSDDPVESLLSALQHLKSNISRVEENHPRLRKDLSELCDLVIIHLTRPMEEQISAVLESPALAACEETAELTEQPEVDPLISRYLEYLHRSHTPGYEPPDNPQPASKPTAANPFSTAVDSTGNHLVKALDSMGDGIIFVIEKLLSLSDRKPRR